MPSVSPPVRATRTLASRRIIRLLSTDPVAPEGGEDGAYAHGAGDPDDFQDLFRELADLPVGAGQDLRTLIDDQHDLRNPGD